MGVSGRNVRQDLADTRVVAGGWGEVGKGSEGLLVVGAGLGPVRWGYPEERGEGVPGRRRGGSKVGPGWCQA